MNTAPNVATHTLHTPTRQVETDPRTTDDFVNVLKDGVEKLLEKDQSFARSLLRQHARRGLTTKQVYWVRKLAGYVENGYPQPVQIDTGDLKPIEDMIHTAIKSGLRHPRVNIDTPDGDHIQITMAGPSARVPGSLNVTDGGPYGNNTWYGRVLGGKFTINQKVADREPEQVKRVTKFLTKLADDPLEVIKEYGQKSGFCACCGRQLTDEVSVARGIGPVCATRFGLT